MIIYAENYTRRDLQINQDVTYVFGDNLMEVGLGGQAAEARGEINALGIPTKRSPSLCFRDSDLDAVIPVWADKFNQINEQLRHNRVVVWPLRGIGTGLAAMPTECPRLWTHLNQFCFVLGIRNGH